MRADVRAPHVVGPAVPAASAERDARAGGLPGDQFDYRQPFEVDLGRAAVIAEALRECGYPDCTAEVARPQCERGVIGRFAADALERYGWRP